MVRTYDTEARKENGRKLNPYYSTLLLLLIGMLCSSMKPQSVKAAGMYSEPGSTTTNHNWAYPVKCHTIAEKNGDTLIVYSISEAGSRQTIAVDKISPEGDRKSYKRLSVPGTTWGGTVYQAPDGCQYITTGNDGEIAFYVMKYDASWNLLGTASVTKEQSYVKSAFEAGNSDMTMAGDYLIVHAARKRPDGHQSNTTIWINSQTMEPVYVPKQYADTHVSHSFSQFVRYDGNRIIMIDQGDAYPRGINMTSQLPDPARKDTKKTLLMKFWLAGSVEETTDMSKLNRTGTTVDGFELGKNHHIVVGTSIPHDTFTSAEEYENYEGSNNIYAILVDKDLSSSTCKWLTSYPSDVRVEHLEMIKVDDDRFIIVYGTGKKETDGNTDTTHYMLIDSNGTVLRSRELSKPFYATSEPSFDGTVLTWCHYVESELGNFVTMSRWNIVTGDFSVRNIVTGTASEISSLFPLEDIRNEYKAGEVVELEFGVFSPVFEETYGSTAAVVWESSDPDVIEVLQEESALSRWASSSSKYDQWYKRTSSSFRAKGEGTATLTCEIGDKRWSAIVTVTPETETTPTPFPVVVPSQAPTGRPTMTPVLVPTKCPTDCPTNRPTEQPTGRPVITSHPSSNPTANPAVTPSFVPTPSPAAGPSSVPTEIPSGDGIETMKPFSTYEPASTGKPGETVLPDGSLTPEPTEVPHAIPSQKPVSTSSPVLSPSQNVPSLNPAVPPASVTKQPAANEEDEYDDDFDDEEDDEDKYGEVWEKGDIFIAGNVRYKISKRKGKKGEVAVVGVKSKKVKSIVIPAKVKKGGITFGVTSIQNNAFRGCKKVRKLTIRSTGIRTIAKKALSGLDKQIRIQIPKGRAKKYRKMLSKCGYRKNIR